MGPSTGKLLNSIKDQSGLNEMNNILVIEAVLLIVPESKEFGLITQ
jgi:hypothetical protein